MDQSKTFWRGYMNFSNMSSELKSGSWQWMTGYIVQVK